MQIAIEARGAQQLLVELLERVCCGHHIGVSLQQVEHRARLELNIRVNEHQVRRRGAQAVVNRHVALTLNERVAALH